MLCKRVLVLAVFGLGLLTTPGSAWAGFGEVLVGESEFGAGHDDFGEPVFRMTGFVTRDTMRFRKAFAGESLINQGSKIEVPSLVLPRDRTHRLGTIFRLSDDFKIVHDSSLARALGAEAIRRGNLSGTLITGLMRTETMEKLVLDSEPILAKSRAKLESAVPDRIGRAMMTVFAKDVQITLLSKQARQNIARQIHGNAKAKPSDTFYIASAIISAGQVRYYIGPSRIKGHELNRNPGQGVSEVDIRRDITRHLSGVYEITHRFQKRKIIAVGYSLVAGATRRGQARLQMHNELGGFGDHFFRHTRPARLLN